MIAAGDMRGRVVLVTGATSGIGRAAAEQLAALGATVLVHGRRPATAEAAASQIRTAVPGARVDAAAGDLTSLEQVRRLAADVMAAHDCLHVLVNNAGVVRRARSVTADGFEETWQVNVLAPFLLTGLVLPRLLASAPSRIVTVSSVEHYRTGIDFPSVEKGGHCRGGRAYAQSKLAEVLLTVELADRLGGTGVTANAVHPGVIMTRLLRSGWVLPYGASASRGGRSLARLASAPDLENVTGAYFNELRRNEPSPLVHDRALRRRLWETVSRQAGVDWPPPADRPRD